MSCKRIVLALLLIVAAFAGTTYTTGTSHRFYVGTVPSSTASAVGSTVYVVSITLINDSSSDVTATVADGDGNLLTPNSVTIPAKSFWTIDYGSEVASNGIRWSASDGTNVTGRIHYRTSLATP
mgnify:FL=1